MVWWSHRVCISAVIIVYADIGGRERETHTVKIKLLSLCPLLLRGNSVIGLYGYILTCFFFLFFLSSVCLFLPCCPLSVLFFFPLATNFLLCARAFVQYMFWWRFVKKSLVKYTLTWTKARVHKEARQESKWVSLPLLQQKYLAKKGYYSSKSSLGYDTAQL